MKRLVQVKDCWIIGKDGVKNKCIFFLTLKSVKRLVQVKDCGIIWEDGVTNKCIFQHFSLGSIIKLLLNSFHLKEYFLYN